MVMDRHDGPQDTESDQWNYLDGTPASRPDDPQVPQAGTFGQAVTDVTSFLNPFRWWRRKPVRAVTQQSHQSRRVDIRTNGSQRPTFQQPPSSDDRPTKRQRGEQFPSLESRDAGNGNEMPPNIDFTEDERPPLNSESYMTDDEDSDAEMSSPGISSGRRPRTITHETERRLLSGTTVGISIPAASLRAPLRDWKDITVAAAPSPPKRNNGLPLLNSASKASNHRHPLMEQTRPSVPSALNAQLQSRKRTFDAVDQDDAASTPMSIFSSFPKKTESPSGPSISRFGPLGRCAGNPSVGKMAAPYYALKRYDGLLNINNASKDIRSNKNVLAPMRPLQPMSMKPFLPKSLGSHIPRLGGKDSVKLDYSYIVSPSKEFTALQDFAASAILPTGQLKSNLENFVQPGTRDGSESRQSSRSPSVRHCAKCGIRIRCDEGSHCDVCEQVKMNRASESIESLSPPERDRKKSRASVPQQEIFDVDDGIWKCSVCDKPNPEGRPACLGCGKVKKVPEKPAKPAPSKSVEQIGTSARPHDPAVALQTENERGGDRVPKRFNGITEQSRHSSDAGPGPEKVAEPAALLAPAGFNDIWAKSAMSKAWSCPECMSSNADALDKCGVCEAVRPGRAAKPSGTTAPSISTSIFGGIQPSTSITNPAAGGILASPSVGFKFGASVSAGPNLPFGLPVTTKPGLSFSGMGQIAAPVTADSTNEVVVPVTATTNAPNFFNTGIGAPSFFSTATNSTGSPLLFTAQAPTIASVISSAAPFSGFSSNTITTSSTAPSVTGTSASGIPVFGGSKSGAFTFGVSGSSFPSFTGAIGGGQASTTFGLQNGSNLMSNGTVGTPASSSSGFVFGNPIAPGQNGVGSFSSGVPAPGTMSSTQVTIGSMGAPGSPRRILRGKRNLKP